MSNVNEVPTIIDARSLQKLIGLLGLLLPVILVVGFAISTHHEVIILPTLSEYVYTAFQPFFTGILFAIGIMFFAYKGYPTNTGPIPLSDNALANIAGTASILTAVIQTSLCYFSSEVSVLFGMLHMIMAVILLITMALFCLFYFTQTGNKAITSSKLIKNRIYRICGSIIVICLITAFFYLVLKSDECSLSTTILWLEWVMIWAFSIAWCIKGGMFLHK